MTLLNHLREFFFNHLKINSLETFNKKIYIAYSGGLDSQVLLHLLVQLRHSYPNLLLVAVHINHGLSENASQWAKHCETVCNKLAVNYLEYALNLTKISGESLEEIARKKRYEILTNLMQADEYIFTAHHQNDQAETLLLQLCRGAGPKGLAAMPVVKPIKQGYLVRPFLSVQREHLSTYATQYGLLWIEDESNANLKFSRNFVRHQVLPLLATRFPAIGTTLARSADQCAETQFLLEQFAEINYQSCLGSKPQTLSVNELNKFSLQEQRLILRLWIEKANFLLPSTKKLNAILQNVVVAGKDRRPAIYWGDIVIRKFKNELYISHYSKQLEHKNIMATWDFSAPIFLNSQQLISKPQQGKGLKPEIKQVQIRFRQPGEKIACKKRGTLTLKNLFQEWQIPPWERATLPLILVDEKVVYIPGYFLHDDYKAQQNEMGTVIFHSHDPITD